MRVFEINYTIAGHNDSIEISGETLHEIQQKAYAELSQRNVNPDDSRFQVFSREVTEKRGYQR